MEESTKKAVKRNLDLLNGCFESIIEGYLPEESIKKEFDCIRLIVDACEELVIEK